MNKASRVFPVLAMTALLVMTMSCATTKSAREISVDQEAIRAVAALTMSQLYKANPAVENEVKKSAGYAVFSDYGMKVMLMGGAGGKGIAVNNVTKKETFMEMAEFQPGVGFGVEKFRLVLIFTSPQAYNNFITSGWELGVNAMATARMKSKGGAWAGAAVLSDDVYLYQLDQNGLIVGLSVTAAKFYKDKELN
jgi:lipid-binding SYLF domain-containing protein